MSIVFNINLYKCQSNKFKFKMNICVIIRSGCNKEYIRQTGGHLKERLSIYRQHIPQPELKKIEVKKHLRTCAKGVFKFFSFLQNERK